MEVGDKKICISFAESAYARHSSNSFGSALAQSQISLHSSQLMQDKEDELAHDVGVGGGTPLLHSLELGVRLAKLADDAHGLHG